MPQNYRRRGRKGYSSEEASAVTRVAAEYHRLQADGKSISETDEADLPDWALFLQGLEEIVVLQRCSAASLKYRLNFTCNYRALLLEDARRYRVDVLQPCLHQHEVIWVNGQKFEFSSETLRSAELLQKSWFELAACLERWHMAGKGQMPCLASRPSRPELRRVLVALDVAWAKFECTYISELIEIERNCRCTLRQAIVQEQRLQQLENLHPSWLHKEELEELLRCLHRLNLETNLHRMVRDDMTLDVLLHSMSVLSRCDALEMDGENTEHLAAARILSNDVMDSFMAMRNYLREASCCLDHVDPHLHNNSGLVAKLSDLEESWEVGARYIQHQGLMDAICDLVAEIRFAQGILPALASMCEDCDVELFMVLPRITWLWCLQKPSLSHELLRSLLPHRCGKCSMGDDPQSSMGDDPENSWLCDPELKALHEKYRSVAAALLVVEGERKEPPVFASASSKALRHRDGAAWQLLIESVVIGAGSSGRAEEACRSLPPAHRALAKKAVEDFMRELETMSMELQRHCPQDWNTFSAILLQCVSGRSRRRKAELPGTFEV